jgi:hypothetical protein
MVIEIPDNLLSSTNSSEEIRRGVAIALFKSGLLPLKNAAKFLGISIAEFRKLAQVNDSGEQEPQPKKKPDLSGDPILMAIAKPIKEKFDFDEIVREQGYKGPNRERFAQIVKELDIQEPIDDLLATLTK